MYLSSYFHHIYGVLLCWLHYFFAVLKYFSIAIHKACHLLIPRCGEYENFATHIATSCSSLQLLQLWVEVSLFCFLLSSFSTYTFLTLCNLACIWWKTTHLSPNRGEEDDTGDENMAFDDLIGLIAMTLL